VTQTHGYQVLHNLHWDNDFTPLHDTPTILDRLKYHKDLVCFLSVLSEPIKIAWWMTDEEGR
jgi:hypothetical protein